MFLRSCLSCWCCIFYYLNSVMLTIYKKYLYSKVNLFSWYGKHCIKYARIRLFTELYSPVQEQNYRFCPYTGEYGLVKIHFLACFAQWKFRGNYQLLPWPTKNKIFLVSRATKEKNALERSKLIWILQIDLCFQMYW